MKKNKKININIPGDESGEGSVIIIRGFDDIVRNPLVEVSEDLNKRASDAR